MRKTAVIQENFIFLLVTAILIGAVSGYLAVGFRFLLLYATDFFWNHPFDIVGSVEKMAWFRILLTPAVGGLLVGLLVTFVSPETRGSGVPEVIESVAMREGSIRHRTTFFKILSSVISIGSGASVGREGPIVQIGSSVGSSIARILRLKPEWQRIFLACGAASGIAATFNAPIAGVLFAIEIILRDFEVSYLTHIVIAAVTATVISHHFLGNLPAFVIPSYSMITYGEIPLYFLLGIMAGLFSIAFIKLVAGMEKGFNVMRVPLYLRPALGGLAVGLIALGWPQILGVGYQSINLVLTAKITLTVMVIILVLKMIASSLCVGAGFSGGILAPSLFLGAMTGGIFGIVAQSIFPGVVAPFQAYGLIGMGAMVSGVTLAPLTAIFTIFELTYNYNVIIPLMMSCIPSLLIVQKLYGHSIYEDRLLKKGINIVRGHDINLLRTIAVSEYMETGYEFLWNTTRLREIVVRAEASRYPHFLVMNHQEELVGMLSLRDLKGCLLPEMEDLMDLVVAADIMTKKIHTITPYDSLATAFDIFEGKQISTLPVVHPLEPQKVLGVLKKSDLILAYNQKILKKQAKI